MIEDFTSELNTLRLLFCILTVYRIDVVNRNDIPGLTNHRSLDEIDSSTRNGRTTHSTQIVWCRFDKGDRQSIN